MRKNLNRVVACMLAAALLISCSISGLVLPVLASSERVNLLAGKVDASYSLSANTGTAVDNISTTLKAGTRYALRMQAKGSVGYISLAESGVWHRLNSAQTTNWREHQVLFTTTAQDDSLYLEIKNTSSSGDFQVRNIELYEAPVDGTFNLISETAGSFGNSTEIVETALFTNHLDSSNGAVSVIGNDGDPVLFFDKSSGSSVSKTLKFNLLGLFQQASELKNVFKLVMKVKGRFRFENSTSNTQLPNPDAYSVSGKYTNYRSDSGWTTISYIFQPDTLGDASYLYLRNSDGAAKDVWIDDVQLYELPEPAALTMSQSELGIYPGNSTQLSVSVTPEKAYCQAEDIVWTSSDPTVVSVDTNGNVKAESTAAFGTQVTIKAAYSETVYAECVVTIDESAPKPPDYTVAGQNGFAGIDTTRIFNGGDAAEGILSNVLLKANTRYALRYTSKSSATGATIAHNGGSTVTSIPVTTEWQVNQVLFTTDAAGARFAVTVTPSATAGTTLEIKDIELWEAPTDGTFNLVPGGTFDEQTAFLSKHYAAGLTNADDPDHAGNKVLMFPIGETSYKNNWQIKGIADTAQLAGTMFKIVLKYKGQIQFNNYTNGNFISWTEATKVTYSNTDPSKVSNLAYSSNEWAELTFYIDTANYNNMHSFEFAHAVYVDGGKNKVLYVDDVQVYEVPAATGLQLSKDTLNLYPGDTKPLTVSSVPENSYLDKTLVTWKTSDDTVATVDANGNVKAVGTDGQTATITVMLDGVDADTCLVTVDLDAPKPPTVTEPGVNAMETVDDFDLGADTTKEIEPGAILKEGTRYALRFTTKSTVAGAMITTNAGTTPFTIPQTDAWRANQMLFTPTAAVASLVITVKTPAGDSVTLNIKDWELYEAPVGEFNIIPGSSSDAQTAFLNRHFTNGDIKAELVKDGDNSVIYLPMVEKQVEQGDSAKTEKYGINQRTDIAATGGWQAGKVWALSFRLKGTVRIENGSSNPVYVSQPDATSVTNNGKYAYFSSEDWRTVTYYLKPSQADYIYLANRGESGAYEKAWIDDICLIELEPSTAFSIVEQDLHLYPTSTKQLTYTWGPEGSVLVGQDVKWKSSDEDVVLVDEKTGRITLVGDNGETAVITAYNDVHSATTTVTVDDTVEHADPVESITIYAPSGQDMDKGETYRFMVIGTPADNLVGRITWTSSNDKVATVDKKGNVTALGIGDATITATTEFGKTESVKITVYDQTNMLINGGFEQGASVSWKNSKWVRDGIGQYGSVGYLINGESSTFYGQDILFKPATTYIISYRYKAEKGANFRLYAGSIGATNLKPSVFCEPGTIDTAEWQYASKTFTTSDYFDLEVGYAFSITTDDTSNEGTGVRAYIDNVAIREYIVGSPVTKLEIEQQDVSLAPGRSTKLTLKATPDPADLNGVEWSSSDEQVAYVVSGHVTGVGTGEAIITAKTKSGVTATCKVTVNGMTAVLQNGTFETKDDPETPENEGVWVLSGNAKYVEGQGVIRSTAIRFDGSSGSGGDAVAAGSISQTFKGLKADTAYQLVFRYRQRNENTKFAMKITNSKGEVVAEGQAGGAQTKRVTYREETFKFDFITPATVSETDELTLTFYYIDAEDAEHIMIDQIMLIEAASEVDLIISDITWSNDNADQVTPGTKLKFYVSVVNQGKEDYPGTKPFVIDIMVDSKKVKSITYQGELTVGQMLIIESAENDEWVATAGDHMITAQVNSTMTILESDDTNNYTTVNLRVAEQDDFVTAPEGALAMGYNRLTFSDHFTTQDTIDKTASGNHGYKWYITRPWGEQNLTANDYRVEDGVLYLTTEQTSWNYSMCTIDAKHPGVGFGFNKGYMEIRVRMKETAEGGTVTKVRVPAVWAFSCDTIWGTREQGKASLELDWIEYWGNKYGDLRFDTTLHETRYDENGKETSKVSSGEKHYEPIGDYQWHTYGMGWSDGVLKTYFDGELIATLKYSEDDYPDPMPGGVINVGGDDDPYEGLWSVLDTQTMPIILGGASDFPLEVDWIHVWQSDGSLEPIEEEDEAVTSFVKKYLTGDDGKVFTELTIDNYEKVLSGESAYLALTAEQQAAIDEKLGDSYIAWIAEIYDTTAIAENFVSYYASAEDGTPYTVVDATNYAWIAGAKAEWDALSDFARALIDKMVEERSAMTFTVMLEQALAFVDTGASGTPQDPNDVKKEPVDLTLLWIVLGAIGGIVVIGGVTIVILLFVRKKKKQ